jgi:riboflavin synthase alpha subunit
MSDFDFIEKYNELRRLCHDLARRNNGELMGSDAWLRHALCESDITLADAGDSINCSGSTYTMQTMDHEWFDFDIPKSEMLVSAAREKLS